MSMRRRFLVIERMLIMASKRVRVSEDFERDFSTDECAHGVGVREAGSEAVSDSIQISS